MSLSLANTMPISSKLKPITSVGKLYIVRGILLESPSELPYNIERLMKNFKRQTKET